MTVPKTTGIRVMFIALSMLYVSGGTNVWADDRETVLERNIHIDDELVKRIPQVPRSCLLGESSKQRVSVGDCKLYCELEGEGMPMVLVHGGPGATHHYFHPAFSRARPSARVIYYDQRGCGLSDYEKGSGYTIDQAVDDLENLRKGLKFGRWVVLGHSYGGLLAQCYAVKYPDHLAGLVLVGSDDAMQIALKPTRQYDFMSDQERARIREIHRMSELTLAQRLYNAFLNGDWKRQHFHKPSRDKLSQIALYEWKHDTGFNGIMSGQMRQIDLQGVFAGCPIPTLIIEGKWDLTWNTDKPGKLHKNHPGAKLILLEESGHSPFDDEPESFFEVLRGLIADLPEVPASNLAAWKGQVAQWSEKRETSPRFIVQSAGWGWRSSQRIAQQYSEAWLEELDDAGLLLRTGFALYDMERYEEALTVFKRMQEKVADNPFYVAVTLIWQGHMLDLLERRDDAIVVYKQAEALSVEGTMQHSQYGLKYAPSSYATQRITEPFARIENLEEPAPAGALDSKADKPIDISVARRRATHLVVHLFAYHAGIGRFPLSLAQLKAPDIATLRIDPYSGHDFVYRRKGKNFTLYSVAQNLEDDGGKHHSIWCEDREGDKRIVVAGDYVFWPVQE